ncbi:hypothetical protein ACJIZ3_001206 [Penstemon smallii]|uniref:Uncharacterized protein n=1 Tax=Penstemon smallii TaxID=265156 RepID=A0ABD3U5C4_9LAMI
MKLIKPCSDLTMHMLERSTDINIFVDFNLHLLEYQVMMFVNPCSDLPSIKQAKNKNLGNFFKPFSGLPSIKQVKNYIRDLFLGNHVIPWRGKVKHVFHSKFMVFVQSVETQSFELWGKLMQDCSLHLRPPDHRPGSELVLSSAWLQNWILPFSCAHFSNSFPVEFPNFGGLSFLIQKVLLPKAACRFTKACEISVRGHCGYANFRDIFIRTGLEESKLFLAIANMIDLELNLSQLHSLINFQNCYTKNLLKADIHYDKMIMLITKSQTETSGASSNISVEHLKSNFLFYEHFVKTLSFCLISLIYSRSFNRKFGQFSWERPVEDSMGNSSNLNFLTSLIVLLLDSIHFIGLPVEENLGADYLFTSSVI